MPKVPFTELTTRLFRFRGQMDKDCPDWEMVIIFGKVNQYYFTGTMQEGMLLIPRNNEAVYWVRKSYDRAITESHFPTIKPMASFKDAAAETANIPQTVYLETELLPLALYQRLQKHFPFSAFKPADLQIGKVRAVKSPYELSLMELSGKIHQQVLEVRVPQLLKEGISEVEFAAALNSALLEEGHQGIVRFSMFDTEVILGHIAFGESSIYPTCFNGPGGNYGMCPAVPVLGSRNRKLSEGDLVFIDIGCGVNGYHTDKTLTYVFKGELPQKAIDIHQRCLNIQERIAAQLKPGAIPSEIYNNIMGNLDADFLQNFMGFGKHQVKFLGHGIGLTIDEIPVIANGFDDPLEEGVVFAVEPKKGIEGIGMVGIENTFIVEPAGGRCITGTHKGLMRVG